MVTVKPPEPFGYPSKLPLAQSQSCSKVKLKKKTSKLLPFNKFPPTLDSSDGMKRTSDSALQYGYQRRTKELADWAKNKRRRYIRREDLLSYLAGKPPPPPSAHSPGHYHSHNTATFNNSSNHHNYSSHHNVVTSRVTQLR
jgi:Domain of unknown function (DUF4588)